jgi:hypothetical protein
MSYNPQLSSSLGYITDMPDPGAADDIDAGAGNSDCRKFVVQFPVTKDRFGAPRIPNSARLWTIALGRRISRWTK